MHKSEFPWGHQYFNTWASRRAASDGTDPQLEQLMSTAVQTNGDIIEPNLVDTGLGIADATGKMEAEGRVRFSSSGIIRGS